MVSVDSALLINPLALPYLVDESISLSTRMPKRARVSERERVSECVCVCERERERESESESESERVKDRE